MTKKQEVQLSHSTASDKQVSQSSVVGKQIPLSFHATQACCSSASKGQGIASFVEVIQQTLIKYKETHCDAENNLLARQIEDLIKTKEASDEANASTRDQTASHSSEDKDHSTDSEADSSDSKVKDKSEDKLFVKPASNADGKRVWDKKHCCLYCHKCSTNLLKHQLAKHASEDHVKQLLSLPKKSKERNLIIEKLRNLGDFQHNCKVIEAGHGQILTWRNPSKAVHPSEYLPCPSCFAFFIKKDLWRHRKVCKFMSREVAKLAFRRLTSTAALLLPMPQDIHAGLKQVLCRMNQDETTFIARNDPVICKLGGKLYQKHGHLPHMHMVISQKIRELGRLLEVIRTKDESLVSLEECLSPEHFPIIVKSVRELCGLSESKNQFAIPSLALKLGHSLKKCAMLVKSTCIMSGDDSKRKKVDDFFSLCELEWTDEISSTALSNLKTAQMNRPQTLPLTADLQKLNECLNNDIIESSRLLCETVETSSWYTLAESTLAKLIIFNRKRSGEAERLLVDTYVGRATQAAPIEDIENALSPCEKVMCSTFTRIEIRGKFGRTVPIILPPQLVTSIDKLMETRQAAGVHVDNAYVFARPCLGSLSSLRGSDCLRKYAKKCGAACPENISSTRLRKHIATVSQILNLSKNELDQLANFLGHDILIHRSFYRLPEDTLQLAKVSKVLMALDGGNISQYSGKSLDEISINPQGKIYTLYIYRSYELQL